MAEIPDGFRVVSQPDAQPASQVSIPKGFEVVSKPQAAPTNAQPAQQQPTPMPPKQPTIADLMGRYKSGQMSPQASAAFEEITKRRLGTQMQIAPPTGAVAEPLATLATGTIAEPVAGLAGLASLLSPTLPTVTSTGIEIPATGGNVEEAEGIISGVRDSLTYKPKTEAGKGSLEAVAETLAPVAEFIGDIEQGLGDTVYDSTGSPALASLATTIPTIVTELLGAALGRGALSSLKKVKAKHSAGQISRAVNESAPTIDALKSAAGDLFDEIDNMGASVKPTSFETLSNNIAKAYDSSGGDVTITPKATAAVKRVQQLAGEEVTLTELETLRRVAQNSANAIEPAEKAIGVRIINEIDDFIESSTGKDLNIPQGVDGKDISNRYKVARGMWGRARKSEMVQDAFEVARNQASGFENGIRTQFRAILNNKKKSKFFNADELKAIKEVVRGTSKQNMAKLVGRLGFSEGSATGIIGGSIGVAGGASVGGPVGAVIVPLVGQISKKLATRMTIRGAEFADEVIRAGNNATDITKAYLKHTPKSQRTASELSELLMQNDIATSGLTGESKLLADAAKIANNRKSELAGAASAAAVTKEQEAEE